MSKMKETEADKAVTQKALENAGGTLFQIVEGLEDLAERMGELRAAAKAKFAAAKSEGYDPAAIRQLLRDRAKTEAQKAAQAELALVVNSYAEALELAEGMA